MRIGWVASFAAVGVMFVSGFPRAARAEAITYIETATATGSLDGQSFTNALVTLTATGDTANPVVGDGVHSAEMSVPLGLTIAGVGSTEFTDSINVVFNGRTGADEGYGFGDSTNNYGLLFTDIPYAGTFYDLLSAIGPIDGTAIYNSGVSFNTAAGGFEMTTGEDATFQAVVTPAATPELSSLMLLGTGALGLAGVMRRRLLA